MSKQTNKDTVYAVPRSSVETFQFDAQVAEVFQDMIERSVPGYGLLLEMIGILVTRYASPGTNCYDLGCSLGASTLQIKRQAPDSCQVIGVDNSPAMVARCQAQLSDDDSATRCEIRLEDLCETKIEKASVVVLNFTLQFVPDAQRQDILRNIAQGLQPGGILLLAEKIHFPEQAQQQLMADLHHDFKKYHGYTALEIAQKRTALEKALQSNTEVEHRKRLSAAGFTQIELCFRCFNFMALLAIK